MKVSRHRLEGGMGGVIEQCGIDLLLLVTRCFGPIDSVYARTRCLAANRPEEDVAAIQLKCKNGLEGIVEFNGLGDRDEVALQLYGHQKEQCLTGLTQVERAAGLRIQYEDFAAVVKEGKAPLCSGHDAFESMLLLEWIRKSARLNKEINRQEVHRE